MKRLLTLGVFTSFTLISIPAATLRGVAVSDELDGPPLPQAVIRAAGSIDARTDELGRFALSLPQVTPGDQVHLTVVVPGYTVVNPTQLDVTALVDEAATALTVILTPLAIRDEMTRRFFQTACLAATRNRIHVLPPNRPEKPQASLPAAERDKELALRAAGPLADQFSKVSEATMSRLYRAALNRFLEGQPSDSLRILGNPRHLALPRLDEPSRANFVELGLLQARILTTQFRFAEAREIYQFVTAEVPESQAAWLEWAQFENMVQRPDESLQAYRQALVLARESKQPDSIATTLVGLGRLHREQDRLDSCRQAWNEALTFRRQLAAADPQTYLPQVAATLIDLANLDVDLGRPQAAQAAYQEAFGIYLPLERSFPIAYAPTMATLRSNLGILASRGGKTGDARVLFEQALRSQRLLARGNPTFHRADLARTLFNLGLLEHRQKQIPRAQASYSEALALYRDLAREQPLSYSADLADTLNNLGILQRDQRQFSEAIDSLQGALVAYQIAAQGQPARFQQAVRRVEAKLRELDEVLESRIPEATPAVNR